MNTVTTRYITGQTLAVIALLFLCVAGGVAILIPPYIYPLAAVIALLVLALMVYSPIAALMTYLVFFLAWPQEWAPYFQYLPDFTERIIGFMAIGSLALAMLFRQRTGFYMGKIGYAAIGLIVAFSLTIFTAFYLTEVKDTLIDLIRLFVVYVLIVNIVDHPRKLRAVAWMYILAVGVMATISVINYYGGVVQYRMGITRAIGLGLSYADPNSHAATIVYCLPVMFYFWREGANRLERFVLAGFGAIGCWNIILTGSRTAMIGILFLLGTIILRSRQKVAYAALAVVVLAGAVVVMPDQYKERFMSSTDLTSDESAAESARGRLEGLVDGFRLFAENPITGVGAGCYADARGAKYGNYLSSHNMLGELIAEGGLVGLAGFGYFIWAIVTTLRSLRRRLREPSDDPNRRLMSGLVQGILVGYGLLFVMGLAGHNLYRYNWFFFGALLTVMERMSRPELTMPTRSDEPESPMSTEKPMIVS